MSTVGGAHYTASKAGVLGFTRHLAREVAANGITVNAICPGLIDTEMVRATISPEHIRAYVETHPMSRRNWSQCPAIQAVRKESRKSLHLNAITLVSTSTGLSALSKYGAKL